MKITICGSINFTYEIKKLADELIEMGHKVVIPITSQKILSGVFSLDDIKNKKKDGSFSDYAIENNSIRTYYYEIKKADAILVVNFDKNNVKNYIGGAVFLEMGFAHILNKRIFILNDIPDMLYTEEIKMMQPIVLKGDLTKIK